MIEVVCALIEDSAGQLLACKRSRSSHLAGHWEFPGGKIEADELPEQALRREIQEELGVGIEVGAPLSAVEWTDGTVAIRLLPFRSRLISGEPRPHDHEEIRWLDGSALEKLKWAPADVPILKEWAEGRQA